MTKTGLAKASFLFALVWFTVFLSGCDRTPEVIKISGGKMGTTYHITIVAEQPAPSDLAEQIDAVLTQVNQSMSRYKPESELSQFNGLAAVQ
ncbi:MAG: FAD:protein FMN transferase, partial [Porticoccaceae bacterium]|nr:FAD:protein FMN transferase [Porticoccaceae bacterium]